MLGSVDGVTVLLTHTMASGIGEGSIGSECPGEGPLPVKALLRGTRPPGAGPTLPFPRRPAAAAEAAADMAVCHCCRLLLGCCLWPSSCG